MTRSIYLKVVVMRHLSFTTMLVLAGGLALQGCTVIAVAGAVGSAAVGAASLATDAAIGTVKVTGKVVGAAADAVIPDSPPAK
jgi:hypothetical protein